MTGAVARGGRWVFTNGAADAAVSLVCVPHAGAGASAYASWRHLLPADVLLHSVQLPGREDRLGEPLPADLGAVADRVAPCLDRQTRSRPLVLFGHSMGGLLAYALAQRLEEAGRPVAHVVVSGCLPADEPVRRP